MTAAHMAIISVPTDFDGKVLIEDRAKKHQALADVDVALSTRIFIADDVETLKVRMKWAEYVTLYFRTKDKASFQASFHALRVSIVRAAKLTK